MATVRRGEESHLAIEAIVVCKRTLVQPKETCLGEMIDMKSPMPNPMWDATNNATVSQKSLPKSPRLRSKAQSESHQK